MSEDEACVLAHADPAERYVGLLCRRHYHWVGDTLREIEALFALSPDTLDRDGSVWEPPIRLELAALTDRRAKTPLDLDLDAGELPDVLGTLESWLGQVDDERHALRRILVDRRGRAERERDALDGGRLTVTQVVGWLRAERRWIAAQEWVADYAAELVAVHRALARGVGASMWPVPIGTCPNCQAKMFPNPTGGVDEVTCRKCKTAWRGVHLARLRLIHEQEAVNA